MLEVSVYKLAQRNEAHSQKGEDMNEHDEQVLRIYTMDDEVDVLMTMAYARTLPGPVDDILADGQRYVAVDIENTLTDDGYRMREQLIAEAWGLA